MVLGPTLMGFLGGVSGKESACQCRGQEMPVQSLGWEDLLEKEMTTHSSILAWEIPWTEEPGGLWSIGYKYRYILRWCSFRTLTHEYWGGAIHPKAEAVTSIIRKCNFWIPIFALYPVVMRLLTKQLVCALKWSHSVVSDSLRLHEL